ncbi:hypothetical protein NMY22_g17718 [Coprinellus aureogranulatus]|nr:hypothetical protein NMY22_g17718 [Coprinellus aureogranulatus]
MTLQLVGATQKLNLGTPSRASSTKDNSIGGYERRVSKTPKRELSLESTGMDVMDVGETNLQGLSSSEAQESRERRKREQVRQEKEAAANGRAQSKKLKGSDVVYAAGEDVDEKGDAILGRPADSDKGGGKGSILDDAPLSVSRSSTSPTRTRKPPREDQLLLKAAANHMPASAKRERKKKVQFGEVEGERLGK